MRIAWCTPFSPPSAIGRFSALVVGELRNLDGWTVDIFHPASSGGRDEPDAGHVLTSKAKDVLRSYERVVYNIGNHHGNHHELLTLSKQVPGPVILHDISLLHLMLPELLVRPRAQVAAEFAARYGPVGTSIADEMFTDTQEWSERAETIVELPMLEDLALTAPVIITHSQFAADVVRRCSPTEVVTLPLPALHAFDEPEPGALPFLDDRPLILQAGALNRNKRIDAVVDAFDQARLGSRAQMVICGHSDETTLAELRRKIDRLGLNSSITVLGAVSDGTLDALRRRADIATVLREPSTEASSAVLIDNMARGIAVVAVDSGHYSEMPDGTVVRISSPIQVAELAERLAELVDDPERRVALGTAAAAHITSHHLASGYARGMAEVLVDGGAGRRRLAVASILADTLRRCGFDGDDEVTPGVATRAHELFGSEPFGRHIIADGAAR